MMNQLELEPHTPPTSYIIKKTFSEQEIRLLYDRYVQGESCHSIASEINYDKSALYKQFKKYGLAVLNRPAPKRLVACELCGKLKEREPCAPKGVCSRQCGRWRKNPVLLFQHMMSQSGLRLCLACYSAKELCAFKANLSVYCLVCSEARKKATPRKYRPPNERTAISQKKWRDSHREIHKLRNYKWRKENPDTFKEIQRRRRARLLGLSLLVISRDIRRLLHRQRGTCYICGNEFGEQCHIEHIVPLVRGGRHSIGNIMLSCPTCNFKKGSRLLVEFKYANNKVSGYYGLAKRNSHDQKSLRFDLEPVSAV